MGNSFAIIFWYSLGDWSFFGEMLKREFFLGTQIEVLVDFCMYYRKNSLFNISTKFWINPDDLNLFGFSNAGCLILTLWTVKKVLIVWFQPHHRCAHSPHLSNNRLYSEIFLKSLTNHLRIRHFQRFPCRVKNKKEKQQKPNEFLTKKKIYI